MSTSERTDCDGPGCGANVTDRYASAGWIRIEETCAEQVSIEVTQGRSPAGGALVARYAGPTRDFCSWTCLHAFMAERGPDRPVGQLPESHRGIDVAPTCCRTMIESAVRALVAHRDRRGAVTFDEVETYGQLAVRLTINECISKVWALRGDGASLGEFVTGITGSAHVR